MNTRKNQRALSGQRSIATLLGAALKKWPSETGDFKGAARPCRVMTLKRPSQFQSASAPLITFCGIAQDQRSTLSQITFVKSGARYETITMCHALCDYRS